MSSGQASHTNTSTTANPAKDQQLEMDDQAVQPESGTEREDDDIRQSSPASERVNNKSMAAPEEA